MEILMSVIDKEYLVTMDDGSVWSVPVKTIAEHRARYRTKGDDSLFEEKMKDTLEYFEDEFEIEDYARNNMNWADVSAYAKMAKEPEDFDFDNGWLNGDIEVK